MIRMGGINKDQKMTVNCWDDVREIYRSSCWNTFLLETVLRMLDKAGLKDGKVVLHHQSKSIREKGEPTIFWFGDDICVSFDIGEGMPSYLHISKYRELTLEIGINPHITDGMDQRYQVKILLDGASICDEELGFTDLEPGLEKMFEGALALYPLSDAGRLH